MKLGLKVTTNVDAMLTQLGEDIQGGKRAGMISVVETARAKITPHVPVVTSNLVNSATTEVSGDGNKGTLRITAPYGRWVNEGTGIYGPYGKKIVPRNAKALKTPYGPRKSVKGMEGRRFVEKGVADLDPQAAFETGMENYLRKQGQIK